ncbi:hypothetical protein [Corynebacterium belfantii]|uniref:hypothetical protein n=1 Tax=Corynebacterium belfantii TaxID=2014537 RepID=UPI0018D35148|nr:hypothetical protein [Corynebacterium belfantii]MBG9243859.1 hypothetical protein [Corynebacterium belfantii]MBG9288440.1 hypothetical protein [Corynebacterium belfantii]MBG9319214.1 hypothetical protein [Corynebacterium belfantii]
MPGRYQTRHPQVSYFCPPLGLEALWLSAEAAARLAVLEYLPPRRTFDAAEAAALLVRR